MKAKLIDLNGVEKQELDLADEIFNIEPNEGVIYRGVQNELANRRLGTASTKGRSDVIGSTKKPWKQKGTGRARAGSVKSPIWRGGGVVFGPKPKDYSYHLPKKIKQLSIRSILSKRNKENRIQVIEDLKIENGKTKEIIDILTKISLVKNELGDVKNNKLRKKMRNYKLTIITDEDQKLLRRSCRNLPWVKCLSYSRLSAYDLFYSHEIVVQKTVLPKLEQFYLSKLEKK